MENQSCCLPSSSPSLWGGGRSTNPSPNPSSSSSSSSSLIDETDIARELNELSFAEREKAMNDLHGVSKVTEETPEFVDSCIKAMDDTLDAMPIRKKREYTRALFLWPGLKNASKFKLRFLRADSYDATKAANRMVNYYAHKRKLFGEEKLVKTITIDDLSDRDLEEFSSGNTMELAHADQSGRPIVFYDDLPTDNGFLEAGNAARALWYIFMTIFDDNDTAQLKGAVGVNRICLNPGSFLNPAWVREWLALQSSAGDALDSALPGRFSSFHLCIDSPSLGSLVSSLCSAIGKTTRLRLRVHTGSDLENEYSLMTFGMPFEGVLQQTRLRSNELHMNYIQRRREIDRQKMDNEFQECVRTGFVAAPNQNDVLFGRGKPYRDFPGNEAWNRVVADHYDRYRLCNTRFEKTCMTMEVVKKAHACHDIRFLLESTDGGWKIIRDDVCLREKASMALKNRAKSLSRMESREMVDGNIAKRRRCESSHVCEGDELEDPFEPLPL